ncbi:MAG: SRPBCC family protein [Archangium sp.]
MLVAALFTTLVLGADDWDTVVKGPIVVKNRSITGTSVKEVWAEGEMNAPALHVEDVLTDIASLSSFMPFMKDAHVIGEPNDDGSLNVYTLIELPIVGKRDYIQKLAFPSRIARDGVFRAEWSSQPEFTPKVKGVIRIVNNAGHWLVTPLDDGKRCRVEYQFTVDPGGVIPAFIANIGNNKGVNDTYAAVQKEANRRALNAAQVASKNPAPGSPDAGVRLPTP